MLPSPKHTSTFLSVVALVLILAACDNTGTSEPERDLDRELIAALTIDDQRRLSNFILPESHDLSAIPQDAANPLTIQKVALGKLLFHETELGSNPRQEVGRGTYSCSTCHHADAGFGAGRMQAIAEGGSGWGVRGELRVPNPAYSETDIDASDLLSPTVLNVAFQRVMLWDGSMGANGPNEGTEALWKPGSATETNLLGYDGLEAQSIAALTTHRMSDFDSSIVSRHPAYATLWDQVFPGEAVSAVNVGLAIAAFQRTVLSDQAPFQRWLRGDYSAMGDEEKRGALVFTLKGQCETCHTGPALNSMAFYALGMPDMNGPGLVGEIPLARGRGGFLNDRAEDFKFKVPQLYNLIDSPFYGHGASFESIREIVEYYNDAVPAVSLPPDILAPRFEPLNLTEDEIDELVEFLTVSLRDPNLDRYVPASVPSGNCIPANDSAARSSLGC